MKTLDELNKQYNKEVAELGLLTLQTEELRLLIKEKSRIILALRKEYEDTKEYIDPAFSKQQAAVPASSEDKQP